MALRAYLVIIDKDFADAAVRKPRDGRAKTKSFDLKIERFTCAPVWQTLARKAAGRHRAPRLVFRMGSAIGDGDGARDWMGNHLQKWARPWSGPLTLWRAPARRFFTRSAGVPAP
jgi:hypothetical protein